MIRLIFPGVPILSVLIIGGTLLWPGTIIEALQAVMGPYSNPIPGLALEEKKGLISERFYSKSSFWEGVGKTSQPTTIPEGFHLRLKGENTWYVIPHVLYQALGEALPQDSGEKGGAIRLLVPIPKDLPEALFFSEWSERHRPVIAMRLSDGKELYDQRRAAAIWEEAKWNDRLFLTNIIVWGLLVLLASGSYMLALYLSLGHEAFLEKINASRRAMEETKQKFRK